MSSDACLAAVAPVRFSHAIGSPTAEQALPVLMASPRARRRLFEALAHRYGPLDIEPRGADLATEWARIALYSGAGWHAATLRQIIDGRQLAFLIEAFAEEGPLHFALSQAGGPETNGSWDDPADLVAAIRRDGLACLKCWRDAALADPDKSALARLMTLAAPVGTFRNARSIAAFDRAAALAGVDAALHTLQMP